jgi:hypothetical protein
MSELYSVSGPGVQVGSSDESAGDAGLPVRLFDAGRDAEPARDTRERPRPIVRMADDDGAALVAWQKCWREGIAPSLTVPQLLALRFGLLADDGRLTQGSTTTPPPMECVKDWPVEAACSIAYALWQGDKLGTVGEVEEAWAHVCWQADVRLNEPAATRYFLNWYDDTPREEMRRDLLREVEREIDERAFDCMEAFKPLATAGPTEQLASALLVAGF